MRPDIMITFRNIKKIRKIINVLQLQGGSWKSLFENQLFDDDSWHHDNHHQDQEDQ